MEAIILRTPARPLESAFADWLRATQKLARATLRALGSALIENSRAALLLRNGSRSRRRF